MQPIDRRALVRAAATTAAGVFALPEVLRAFAVRQDPQPNGQQGGPKEPSRAEQVAAAVARCKAEGRPLLVFVVPARQGDHGARQLRLGAFLNHGGSNALLEVALCLPVCASVDDLKAHLCGKEIAGEPLMLLVDFAAGAAPVVVAVDPKVDEPPPWRSNQLPYEQFLAAEKKAIEAGIEATTAELHKALHVGGDSLTRLSQRVRDRLADQEQRKLDAWFAGGAVPGDELLVRAAAVVRVAAGKQPDAQRAATTAVLLAAIDRALVHKRIAGSRWATSTGCGERIEDPERGEPALTVACGMGHVPEASQRFLDFLTGA